MVRASARERPVGEHGEQPELDRAQQRLRAPKGEAELHDGVRRYGIVRLRSFDWIGWFMAGLQVMEGRETSFVICKCGMYAVLIFHATFHRHVAKVGGDCANGGSMRLHFETMRVGYRTPRAPAR